MNNWIEWTGGKQPVGDEVAVEVKLACGTVLEDVAYGFDWCKGSRLPIVAYRVLYDIAPNYREPAQGSDWVEWDGGKQPVDDDVVVEIFLREGTHLEQEAGAVDWTRDDDSGNGDVMEYRVLGSTHERGGEMNNWIEWTGGEQPVDDEVVVDIVMRVGSLEEQTAGVVDWANDGGNSDVIGYRVLYDIAPSYRKPAETGKYTRIIKSETVDVYDVLQAFYVTNPALQHLIKKALCVGIRGHKTAEQDYQDIIDSAIRAKEIH